MLQVMERGGEGLGPRARDETTKEERPALKRVRKMMVGSRCLCLYLSLCLKLMVLFRCLDLLLMVMGVRLLLVLLSLLLLALGLRTRA